MRSAAGRVTGPIQSFHRSQKDAGVPTMPAKWSSLKSGERHEFVCLQIDIAGHSKLDDSERILHEVKERFHKQIAGLVAIHDGQPFKWEGDGGAFLFLSTESRAFDESVYAAFDILDALPRINDQLRMAHQLSQTLSVRISLDTGVAVYDKDPGLITGDFLNAFLKHERAISLVNAVTITDRVHRQISGPLRGRFTGSKHSEELGCRIYRSVSAEPKTAPDTSPEVKPPRSQPADTPQGPPPGNVFQPPRQASVSSNRISLTMSKTVFVSYSHKQGDWVWDRLMNCLKAGGTEVLIDREQVEAARRLYQQLDDVQDRAALNVLVFSPEYLNSKVLPARDEAGPPARPEVRQGDCHPRQAGRVRITTGDQAMGPTVCGPPRRSEHCSVGLPAEEVRRGPGDDGARVVARTG